MHLSKNQFYFAYALQVMIATLLIVVGYIVTPLLFSELSSKVAGDIAGQLFDMLAIFSIIGFVILAFQSCRHNQKLSSRWQWLLSLIIMTVLLFGLAPWMADIKSAYPQGISQDSADWKLFSTLHGVYQLGYLSVLILTLYGMFRSVKTRNLALKNGE